MININEQLDFKINPDDYLKQFPSQYRRHVNIYNRSENGFEAISRYSDGNNYLSFVGDYGKWGHNFNFLSNSKANPICTGAVEIVVYKVKGKETKSGKKALVGEEKKMYNKWSSFIKESLSSLSTKTANEYHKNSNESSFFLEVEIKSHSELQMFVETLISIYEGKTKKPTGKSFRRKRV